MLLHPAQTAIAEDTHRFRVLVCGRKLGKTTLASEELAGCAAAKGGRRVMYVAPTLDDARRLMWDRLKRLCAGILTDSNDTRMHLKVRTRDKGISDIFLGSWEKIQNYRGDEFDLIVPDEVQDYRDFWTGWHEALRPTLSPRRGAALFMGTPKGFTHLYDLYNFEARDEDYKSFHFTTYDNPHIHRDEIESARKELTEDRFAQEYLADFRKMEGLVYKEFDRKRHVYRTGQHPHNTIRRLIGIDWGYTNPACILEVEEDADRNFYVASEYYKTGKTTPELIEYAMSLRANAYYPDPAEPDRIESLRRAGANVQDVNKDVTAGIDSVRQLFKTGKLFIHESCLNLISELESYRYAEKKQDKNAPEEPVKEDDHGADALRYVMHMTAAAPLTRAVSQSRSTFIPYGTKRAIVPS